MRTLLLLVVMMLIGGCGSNGTGTADPAGTVVEDRVELPEPARSGGGSLAEALVQRRSIRDYRPEPLSPAEMSQLLWAAQGITSDVGQRTAPSAGGLYPLELYVVTDAGHFHYRPDHHQLEALSAGDLRGDLSEAALSQTAVADAPAVFVITAVYARTEQRYGDRAERYVELEAGHAAQNLLLQATSLGLGAVPIGAFYDERVQAVLDLPADNQPLYLIPVGHTVARPD